MLILLESIGMCFVVVMVCVVGIRNGAEKFVAFYEKDVQKRVVELGYTTKETIKKSAIIFGLALYSILICHTGNGLLCKWCQRFSGNIHTNHGYIFDKLCI